MTTNLSSHAKAMSQDKEFEKLRNLLLGDDYEKVIRQFVVDGETDVVARVLTEALRQRNQQDDSFAEELSPVIESSIDASIKRDPKKITNVIFPVIGPAVRKAVASAIADMLQSLNYLLQQSLSVKALVWRFNAWRIKMPYPQYVLLKTLKYRVEQVFLIHKETGLLIDSVNRPDVVTEDADLVSSMLAAINDFVADSFSEKDGQLNVIQVGELTVLIESGPLAIIAYALRGTINHSVKDSAAKLTEKIHQDYLRELEAFDGDTTAFHSVHPQLKTGLIEDSVQIKQQKPWLAMIAVTIALVFFGYHYWQSWTIDQQIAADIQALNSQPGVDVLSYQFENNELRVQILRAPSSQSTDKLSSIFTARPWTTILDSRLAISQELSMLIPAIIQQLSLSSETLLQVENNQLIVSGKMTSEQWQSLQRNSIVQANFAQIIQRQLDIGPSLSVRQQMAQELEQIATELNNTHLYFESGTATLTAASQTDFAMLVEKLKRVVEINQDVSPYFLRLAIAGFADNDGNNRLNKSLSTQRADAIKSMLQMNEIVLPSIVTWGVGNPQGENLPADKQRRVDIQILYQLDSSATLNQDTQS